MMMQMLGGLLPHLPPKGVTNAARSGTPPVPKFSFGVKVDCVLL
jgi:hypothetical protein